MVVATTAAVGAIVATGGAAAPAAGAAAGVASGTTGLGMATTVGSGTAVAGSASVGAAAGSIAGATATGTAAGAGVGGAVGSAAATGVSATGVGVMLGPIGWVVLGASKEETEYTWDCWKPVLRDTSTDPSSGRFLKDVAADRRIKTCRIINGADLPVMTLTNIWDEHFEIEFLRLPTGELAAHARAY